MFNNYFFEFFWCYIIHRLLFCFLTIYFEFENKVVFIQKFLLPFIISVFTLLYNYLNSLFVKFIVFLFNSGILHFNYLFLHNKPFFSFFLIFKSNLLKCLGLADIFEIGT